MPTRMKEPESAVVLDDVANGGRLFQAETGQFTRDIAEARYRSSTATMSDDAFRMS